MKLKDLHESPLTNFTDTKVGDKVTSLINGVGEVTDVYNPEHTNYPIDVTFENGETDTFRLDGKVNLGNRNPTLIKGVVEIELTTWNDWLFS